MVEKEPNQTVRLRDLAPADELLTLIMEATRSVEDDLALEDAGWINLSATTADVISSQERITNLQLSRLYAVKDPLGKQAIRLWTDYTFGSGMAWDTEDEKAKEALGKFWNSKANQGVLSARGQRKSSDKLLIDGEVFFAIFLGAEGAATIRRIDPLEITEIITDADDKEDVRYYRRQWSDAHGKSFEGIYRDSTNIADKPATDMYGNPRMKTEDALIYHLAYNTTSQRGNPLLLPALVWLKYNTKFLSSRIAIMLALAKFAWKSKVKGGQAAVDTIKAKTHDKEIAAGSTLLENLGVDTTPIKTETGAQGAYQDGRMIKLMFHSAVGFPEQYFGDISIGNLATAKTVELPVSKMIQSYQKVWSDAFQDMDEIVMEHNDVPPENWYVDRDFPPIAEEDVLAEATALVQVLTVMPEFATLPDVQQAALLILGINDPAEVLDQLSKEAAGNPEVALIKTLKVIREALQNKEQK